MISRAATFLPAPPNTSLKLTYSLNTVKGTSEIIERNVLITDERHKFETIHGSNSMVTGDCDVSAFISIHPYIPRHSETNLYRNHGNRCLSRHRWNIQTSSITVSSLANYTLLTALTHRCSLREKIMAECNTTVASWHIPQCSANVSLLWVIIFFLAF